MIVRQGGKSLSGDPFSSMRLYTKMGPGSGEV
jgi:hypothetical protein